MLSPIQKTSFSWRLAILSITRVVLEIVTTIGAAIDVVKSHARCSINILSLLAGGGKSFLN